jgi:hypothetical protein
VICNLGVVGSNPTRGSKSTKAKPEKFRLFILSGLWRMENIIIR